MPNEREGWASRRLRRVALITENINEQPFVYHSN